MFESLPFNPYAKLLGLPEETTDPNHYELLGLETGVDDPDAIKNACQDQYAKLLLWQNNEEFYPVVKKLMEIVVEARLVLLNPEQKAEYDSRVAVGVIPSRSVADTREIGNQPTASDITNPYTQYLGLATHITEPNHYELLDIALCTDDLGTIRSAATSQNRKLERWQNDPGHNEAATKIGEQITSAKKTLADRLQKREYDRSLGRKEFPPPKRPERPTVQGSQLAQKRNLQPTPPGNNSHQIPRQVPNPSKPLPIFLPLLWVGRGLRWMTQSFAAIFQVLPIKNLGAALFILGAFLFIVRIAGGPFDQIDYRAH